MEQQFELQAELLPTPTPKVKKTVAKASNKCKDCPDYSKEDLLREKILSFRGKGYNDNQIAAMLMIHKQYVEKVK